MRYVLSSTIRHNTKSYGPGQESELIAALSEEQKADFIRRDLLSPVAVEGVALDDSSAELSELREQLDGTKSTLNSLLDLLRPHVGETGQDESAVDVLQRILTDRSEVEEEMSSLDTRLEALASGISMAAGFERHTDENPLEMLERYVAETAKSAADGLSQTLTQVGEAGKGATEASTQVQQLGQSAASLQSLTVESLSGAGIDPKAAKSLLDAGFDSREKIAAASDEQLTALSDIGKATVTKLRALAVA